MADFFCFKKHYICHMKSFWFIGAIFVLMLAGCNRPSAETRRAVSPRPELAAVDSLMWSRPDSAFALLLEFADSPVADSLDAFNWHYCQLLVSELLYKNDYEQTNREELLEAVDYFDSIGDVFLDARAHYIKGVGFYEMESVVDACAEYLRALEVMEGHFEEDALFGHKAMFMFFTYNRLLELFSSQFMMDPAIDCGEHALDYCRKEPSLFKEIPNTCLHIGNEYDKKGEMEIAKGYYGTVIEILSDINNPVYRDAVVMNALCDYQLGYGADTLLSSIGQVLPFSNGEKEKLTRYLTIGVILTIEQLYDSALLYLTPVFEDGEDLTLKMLAAEYLQIVCENLGNEEKLDVYMRYMISCKEPEGEDKAMASNLEDLFKGYLNRKQAKQVEADRKRSIRKTIAIIVPIVIFVAAIIMIVAIFRRKKMREEHEILRQDLQSHKEQVDALRRAIGQRREEKDGRCEMFLSEEICQRILKMVQGKRITARDNSFQHGIVLQEEDCCQLMEAVEKHYKGFDGRLLGQCADLKRRDLTLCHLYLLKFDESTIAALMGRTYSAIKKQNENLQKKLGIEISIAAYVLLVAEDLCTVQSDLQSVPQGVLQEVPQDYSQIILEIVSNNPQITREEIANQLNISTKTVGRYLKKLSGRIRYVGSGYSGHWEVAG